MRVRTRALVVLSLLFAQSGASAQTAPTGSVPKAHATIDSEVRGLFRFRARTGKTPLAYVESERFETDGVAPVVIRFAAPPSATKLKDLASRGVESITALASGAYSAKINAAHLALLESDPTVLRVTLDLPRRAPKALDQSAIETGIAAARRTLRKKDGTLLDGTGVRIADIDSGCFVFHPVFYRADAGIYAWVDVDSDGKLTPGKDGVDLDASGSIEPGEVLRTLIVESPDRRSSEFDAGIDYLYVDENGNGTRDFGREYTESTPAHGEPIFVVDDADGSGKLAVSEKLLRLGTSKIAAVRGSKTYTRGSSTGGILAYGASLLRNEQLLSDASHGTSVAAILVGGVPDISRSLGLAPGAELLAVGYGSRDPSGTTASVQWAIDQKADVILTEYAPYTGYPLDGSTEEETLLDAAVEKGIAVVNPAGNLARGYKHRTVNLAAGSNTIELRTDGSFANSPYIALTLLHRGDPRALTLQLTMPDASVVDIPAASTDGPVDVATGRLLDVVRRTTARGTHEIQIQLYAWDGSTYGKLPAGKYKLSVTSDAPVETDLYCSDAYNSWGGGFMFTENTPTRTVCHPATNDKGIAVAAYNVREDPWMDPIGALASYSSIGPRIDGVVGMDLAAPANPFAATVPDAPTSKAVVFDQFGGTSGAGPHVAAALALVKQMNPTLGGAALQQKLLDSARRDSFVTTDENRWGKGKLDVAAALGIARKNGTPPKVTLVVPPDPTVGKPVEVKLEVEDDGADLLARWDLDYDGKFDTGWEAIASRTFTSDAIATRDIKVEVLDADGYLGGATARIVFGAPKPDALTPASDGDAGGGGCGCSTTPSRAAPVSIVAAFVALAFIRRRSRAASQRSDDRAAARLT